MMGLVVSFWLLISLLKLSVITPILRYESSIISPLSLSYSRDSIERKSTKPPVKSFTFGKK